MRYIHSIIKLVIRNSHFDLYYLYSSTSYFGVTIDFLLTNKDVKQLEELQLKSKLLTTEMFLKSGKSQKGLYEIDNKKYFFEERQNEIIYRVSEIDK